MRATALALFLALGMPAGAAALPQVVGVYPSGASVPENLLRISIRFAAPVAGPILPDLALWRSGAALLQAPFLDQELWSPDGRTLTLLFHPGRVKSGLVAHDTLGRALQSGSEVKLVLGVQELKSWRVESEDRASPEPSQWRIGKARTGTREPLRVIFESPVDEGSVSLIAVVDSQDRKVQGRAKLTGGESEWVFTPERAWKRAPYRLVVHPRLEDPCGNAVGQRFERPTSIGEPHPESAQAIEIPIPGGFRPTAK